MLNFRKCLIFAIKSQAVLTPKYCKNCLIFLPGTISEILRG